MLSCSAMPSTLIVWFLVPVFPINLVMLLLLLLIIYTARLLPSFRRKTHLTYDELHHLFDPVDFSSGTYCLQIVSMFQLSLLAIEE